MTDEEQAIFNSFLRLPDIMYAGYEVQIGDKHIGELSFRRLC